MRFFFGSFCVVFFISNPRHFEMSNVGLLRLENILRLNYFLTSYIMLFEGLLKIVFKYFQSEEILKMP